MSITSTSRRRPCARTLAKTIKSCSSHRISGAGNVSSAAKILSSIIAAPVTVLLVWRLIFYSVEGCCHCIHNTIFVQTLT